MRTSSAPRTSPQRIEEGFDDFDVAIATPDQMGVVGRLGRILGPRGKMPNPKTGTVTMDVAKAVQDSKGGKLEYRTDRGANVHMPIGKRSFDVKALLENYATLVDEIVRAKPAAAKGRYIRGVTLTSTMGPGIHIDPSRTRGIVEELEESADAESSREAAAVVPDQTLGRQRQPAARESRSPAEVEPQLGLSVPWPASVRA